MAAKLERDEFVLSTGRRVYAHCGILSVNDALTEVTYGYDGGVWYEDEFFDADVTERLSPGELIELAEVMQARWARFIEKMREAASVEATRLGQEMNLD